MTVYRIAKEKKNIFFSYWDLNCLPSGHFHPNAALAGLVTADRLRQQRCPTSGISTTETFWLSLNEKAEKCYRGQQGRCRYVVNVIFTDILVCKCNWRNYILMGKLNNSFIIPSPPTYIPNALSEEDWWAYQSPLSVMSVTDSVSLPRLLISHHDNNTTTCILWLTSIKNVWGMFPSLLDILFQCLTSARTKNVMQIF